MAEIASNQLLRGNTYLIRDDAHQVIGIYSGVNGVGMYFFEVDEADYNSPLVESDGDDHYVRLKVGNRDTHEGFYLWTRPGRIYIYESSEYEPGMMKGGKKRNYRTKRRTHRTKRRTHKSKKRRTHRR